jgi:hypothetical protein
MSVPTTLYLECILTEEEIAQRHQDLKVAEIQRMKADDELALAADDWKRRKKSLEGAVQAASSTCREIATELKTGRSMRNVDCVREVHPPHVLTIRLDTGVVVHTRAATSEELQMELPQ